MVTSWPVRAGGLLAVAVLLLGGCSTPAGRLRVLAGAAGGPGTELLQVNPYDAAGAAAGIKVVLEATGNCQSSNSDASNRNAFRCFIDQTDPSGGNIEDPCFAPPSDAGDGSLLCLTDPQAHSAVRVIPSQRPQPSAIANADPWYLQLEDGTLCALADGATDELDGMRLNYSCVDDSYLYGDPDRGTPIWTIARKTDATPLGPARIARAWR
ncbi:hypothetical protein AB0J86_19885 [Micromonospora sp. NPDC049559]|uniref:hypothetical protein n=1 Tax=Micromonospora sp. NPDC049559 TaxID=3155923 RepID=UPI00341EF268